MKHEITQKQLEELTKKEYTKFLKWLVENGYHRDARITISLMIEYLGNNWYDHKRINSGIDFEEHCLPKNDNLCDDLWEAVKEDFKQLRLK